MKKLVLTKQVNAINTVELYGYTREAAGQGCGTGCGECACSNSGGCNNGCDCGCH